MRWLGGTPTKRLKKNDRRSSEVVILTLLPFCRFNSKEEQINQTPNPWQIQQPSGGCIFRVSEPPARPPQKNTLVTTPAKDNGGETRTR